MRKVSLLLIVAAAAAASFSKPAVAFEPAQDKAAEVLANMRKAIGAGKLDTLKTFSLEAKTARNVGERQMTSDIELFLEIPDKYLRVENITAPVARTVSTGFNGDTVIRPAASGGPGGPVMIMNGVAMGGGRGGGEMIITTTRGGGDGGGGRGGAPGTPPTPEQMAMMNNAMLRSQRVEISRYMLGWFGIAHPGLNATYTYAGEAEAPDGKAHVIDIKADGGFAVKLFVDQATNMPLMLTYVQQERIMTAQAPPPAAAAAADVHAVAHGAPPPPPPPPPPGAQGAAPPSQMTPEEMQKRADAIRNTPQTPIEYRIFFGDWKEVDGVKFPHMLQRARLGNTTEEWTISKVKVNPKIDAKKFSTQ